MNFPGPKIPGIGSRGPLPLKIVVPSTPPITVPSVIPPTVVVLRRKKGEDIEARPLDSLATTCPHCHRNIKISVSK